MSNHELWELKSMQYVRYKSMAIIGIILGFLVFANALALKMEPQWILLYISILCAGLMASERN